VYRIHLNRQLRLILMCAAVVLISSIAAFAEQIDLNFGTLPSQQGWSYEGVEPEASLFSLDGNMLRMDSRGSGDPRARYAQFGVIDPSRPFSLDFSLRIIDSDNSPESEQVFYLGAIGPGFDAEVDWSTIQGEGSAFAGAQVKKPQGTFDVGATVDANFHDYLLSAVPGGPLKFFIDGNPVAEGQTSTFSFDDILFFGDPGLAGALVDVQRFSFDQPPVQTEVPEPSAFELLLLVGSVFIFAAPEIRYRARSERRQDPEA